MFVCLFEKASCICTPLINHGKLSTQDTNAPFQKENQRWGWEEGVIEISRMRAWRGRGALAFQDFLCDLQTVKEQKQFLLQYHGGKSSHEP